MKKVFKYGTGHIIPEGAVYLCSKVEKTIHIEKAKDIGEERRTEQNTYVWHYFLVEVKE